MPDDVLAGATIAEPRSPAVPAADGAPVSVTGRRERAVGGLLLEVALIAIGVLLALMVDQWRERAQHRELAASSLRRFRSEIAANRQALAAVTDYHATTRKHLETFFASDRPKNAANFDVPFQGLGPVFFEQTAWDLALATQSLAYIDRDLAFALSRAYTIQRGYTMQQAAIVQSTIYGRSWTQDFEGYWRSVMADYGDLAFLDPTLLRAYDEVLPQVDRALGATAKTAAAQGRLPSIGIAALDTNGRWCAAFADSLRPGDRVSVVFAEPADVPASSARVVARRTRPCETAFAQPSLSELGAYDLAIDSPRTGASTAPLAALAVAGTAAWSRGNDGIVRADLDGDGRPEEARVCRAGEGQHFTVWSVDPAGKRQRRWHGYFDLGAYVDENCRPDETQ